MLKSKIVALLAVLILAGCDINEQDADSGTLSINNEPVYLKPSSSGIIDLNSRILTPAKIRIEVTGLTRQGSLTDMGSGLLQYSPFVGNQLKDSFRFSIFNASNQMVDSDTIGIIVTSDTTRRPCALYAYDDYRYNITGPATIDVRINDSFCNGTTLLSIHNPGPDSPPHFGTARVENDRVVYTPSASYSGSDKVIYKLTSSNTSIAPAYGILYVTSGNICIPKATDDTYTSAERLSKNQKITIDVLANDQQCDVKFKQLSVSLTPKFGRASIVDNRVVYTAPDTIRQYPFEDSFRYSIQNDGQIVTAGVSIKAGASTGPCHVVANADFFDLSQNEINPMYLDVLFNDAKCDSITSLTVTKPPINGTATLALGRKTIEYIRNQSTQANDSLEYKICGLSGSCSTAKVRIKRKP